MEEGEKRRKKRRIEKERERRRKTGKKVVEWHDKYLSMRFKSATKCRRGGRKPEEKYTTVYRIIRGRIGGGGRRGASVSALVEQRATRPT